MYGRWGTFAVGLGLVLAPLAIGYQQIFPTLHDVAIGLLICILALAALEVPALRFLNALPAVWLVWAGRTAEDPSARLIEVIGGALLVAAALLPRARVVVAERDRAAERA